MARSQLAAVVVFADEGPPKPSPSPTPPPVFAAFSPAEDAQAKAIAEATSLVVRIDAERAIAQAGAPAFQQALAWVWPVRAS
jgi:hypothetical protein